MPVPADPGRNTLLVTTAPQATDEEASAIALRSFGVVANAKVLTSERDKNFHMQAADGREFVLKITNSAEEPGVTNLQTEALRHIDRRAPHLPVPRVCPTLDGRFEAVVALGNGSDHVVRLLTFLSGEPLYKTAPSLRQSAELGACLAAINVALRDFHHSAASHELLWDLKHASKLRALLPHIADERRLALATEGLDYYEQHVQPVVATFRTQVVHNDFNPHNVLVDPDDPTHVTGVIDFGDMVETQLVNDVAIAASYQIEGEDLLERAAKFVAAFHSVYPLALAEIDSLFDLITLRHIMTVAITEWRASLYPDNKSYILRNHPRAAAALETLNRIGRAKAGETLRCACDME